MPFVLILFSFVIKNRLDEQFDSVDRSKLDVSELEKLVLLKKLDVLEVKKAFYEKAHNVLDLLKDTFLNNK